MTTSVTAHYAAGVAAGRVESDEAQLAVLDRMAQLEARLAEHRLARKSSALGWLFAGRERKLPPIKGLYIHGEVGRGKTMLMDFFFETSPVERKRRAHFHEFMLDVHERVFAIRQAMKRGEHQDEDPIKRVADALADEAWLLCFDEFHVTDIADAMILGRLFAQLFARGIVLVATSNVAPDHLYKDGLNRALFVPFIRMLQEHVDVVRLDARTDFRLEKLAGLPVWYVPADAAADAKLDAAWRRLTGGHQGAPQELAVRGRTLHVPRAFMGVARFSFHDLCEAPLAAADYLRIAHEYHTVILDRVPVMTYDNRNAAKRFIILVDTLYDLNVKLIASADAEPDALYRADEGFEAAEFKRTASRLVEMGSQAYLAAPHGAAHGKISGASTGIVET
ncbi:MAG TPA: cell division protein ZapE [Xanthobacteraceae bacterium]|nr:cell division protein ZapE [Xanthobacteraceae bacterium]